MLVSSSYKEKKYVRLWWFALANDLAFLRGKDAPKYPGIIFNVGRDRKSPERLIRASRPPLDLGNFEYTVGSGRNQIQKNWGYLAVQLDRTLPHMIVDAKWNNTVGSNLPVKFSRDQALSLEGRFDEHFTLYCPKSYERDALYVFTPDLMARLIDYAPFLDIEIVDDWMFFYSSRPFDLADARTTSQMFWIADSVGAVTLKRTARYADDRAAKVVVEPPAIETEEGVNPALTGSKARAHGINRMQSNLVAPQGRRLRIRLPAFTMFSLIVFGILMALIFF